MAVKMERVEDYLETIFLMIVNILKFLLQIFGKAIILYRHTRCHFDGIFINGNSAAECC